MASEDSVLGHPVLPSQSSKLKGIVSRDFLVCFDRSEVRLLLKLRFRVEIFDFRVSA
jgi:hypothetical protein